MSWSRTWYWVWRTRSLRVERMWSENKVRPCPCQRRRVHFCRKMGHTEHLPRRDGDEASVLVRSTELDPAGPVRAGVGGTPVSTSSSESPTSSQNLPAAGRGPSGCHNADDRRQQTTSDLAVLAGPADGWPRPRTSLQLPAMPTEPTRNTAPPSVSHRPLRHRPQDPDPRRRFRLPQND